jgi:two-component system, cell cycle response regulator
MDAKSSTHLCPSPMLLERDASGAAAAAPSAYMIVVNGCVPGTMVALSESGTTIGRAGDNGFQIDDITVSRRHALVAVDGQGNVWITDQGSANGTFVNGEAIPPNRPIALDDRDRVQLGARVVFKVVRLDPHDERFQRDMFERSVRDTLTGLYHRAYFLSQVGPLAERHATAGIGMAVLMLDIDHFKQINDRYGHVAGDEVLREVATVIRESTRAEDLVARYGGEEFVIALPVSLATLAVQRAERIRIELSDRVIDAGKHHVRLTASVGLSFNPPGRPRNERALIISADQALYQAKARGRNRVVCAAPLSQDDSNRTESSILVAMPAT